MKKLLVAVPIVGAYLAAVNLPLILTGTLGAAVVAKFAQNQRNRKLSAKPKQSE